MGADRMLRSASGFNWAERQKRLLPGEALQAVEKAQNRQENPRKTKLFSLEKFGAAWSALAGFGEIWNRLGKPA